MGIKRSAWAGGWGLEVAYFLIQSIDTVGTRRSLVVYFPRLGMLDMAHPLQCGPLLD